jgi:hypothetical protein
MTLKEYIEGLQSFAKENPDALELQVITAADDEGNGYNPVYYGPTKGNYDEDDYDCAYISINQFEEWDREDPDVNAVCVN